MATEVAWLNGNRLMERRKRKCALTSTGLLIEGVVQKVLLGSQGSSVPPPFSVEGGTASVDRQFDIGRMAETGRGAGHGDEEGSLRCAVLRWRERRGSGT